MPGHSRLAVTVIGKTTVNSHLDCRAVVMLIVMLIRQPRTKKRLFAL